MINMALPKGRLGDKVINIFKNSGCIDKDMNFESRKLVFVDEKNGVSFFMVKPSDVPIYVEKGVADIGVAGKDILLEYSSDVYELLDLKLGKCKMAVAGKSDFVDDEERVLKVATKFVSIAKEHFSKFNREIEIIKLNGSIELAPLLNMADVIVDIVETGTTLKENGLVVMEDIMPISARLIANKSEYIFKEQEITNVIEKLKGEL